MKKTIFSNQFLSKSKNLVIIKKNNKEYVAYHRLFGNLRCINEEAKDLLDKFEFPQSSEIINKTYSYNDKLLNSTINELHNIYFLVNPEEDERQYLASYIKNKKEDALIGKEIGGIQLNINNNCNLCCRYCFAQAATNRRKATVNNTSQQRSKTSQMSADTAIEAISKFIELRKKNNLNSIVVKFFGGEPLLSTSLIKTIVEHFSHIDEDNDFTVHWAITTNGSLVSDSIARLFRKHNFLVTISIDGTGDFHNFLRPAKEESHNSFKMTHDSLLVLKNHGIPFDFSAVLTNYNKLNISSDFLEYADSFEIREIKVLLAMQSNLLNLEDPEMLAELLLNIYKNALDKNIAITGYWYNPFSTLLHTNMDRQNKRIIRNVQNSCAATDFQVSIEPDGMVFPCKAMSMTLGHFSDLNQILSSSNNLKARLRTYGNVPECINCELEGFCQGECLGHIEHMFNDIYRIDNKFCEVYRKITKKLIGYSDIHYNWG